MTLTLLSAQFSLPLQLTDIARWRGAWCEMSGWDIDYFHNHRVGDGKVLYRYPLLQYRARSRQAGFVAIQEAVPAVQKTLIQNEWTIRWQNEPVPLSLQQMQLRTYELHLDSRWHYYRLHSYLPFNSENFSQWQQSERLHDKIDLLTRLLPSHIISFAKGIQWRIPGRFDLELTDFTRQQPRTLHDILRPAFDLCFRTQLYLPDGIGVGKGVSHGFGMLQEI